MSSNENQPSSPLVYEPSRVSWATSEFVRRPPKLASLAFVYVLSAVLPLGLGYSYFVRVPTMVSAEGALATERPPIPIFAPFALKVRELNIKENQRVAAGEPLLVTDDQLDDRELAKLETLIADLQSSLNRGGAGGQCDAGCLDGLRKRSAETAALRLKGSLSEPFTDIQNLIREYVRLGALDLEPGRKRTTASTEQLREARERLEARLNNFMPLVRDFRASQTIHASVAGYVTNLAVNGPGQSIASGTTLLSILPLDSPLGVELMVANTDIPKLNLNQRVRVKLPAFPEREYGLVSATITELPSNVTPPTGGGNGSASPRYRVKARLDVQSVEKDGRMFPFRSGMVLTGVVTVGRDRLLTLAVKEIFKLEDTLIE